MTTAPPPSGLRRAAVGFVVAACGGSGTTPVAVGIGPGHVRTAPASAAPSVEAPSSAAPSTPAGPATKVRLALDWTPNTNHTGFYVAQAKGWYARRRHRARRAARTATTTPETILAAHQAECGISFQDSLTFAVAAGAAHPSVDGDPPAHGRRRSPCSPRRRSSARSELDGKTYAGFGYPNEVPTLKAVIRHDGGKGDFDDVTLDTAAYEALYQKRADFVITFSAWEGIEAGQRGIDAADVPVHRLRVPGLLPGRARVRPRLAGRDPEAAKAFVGATVRGFEFAAQDPDAAAQILVDAEPGRVRRQPGPAARVGRVTSPSRTCWSTRPATPARRRSRRWTGYSGFLYDQGLLVDAYGKPLTAPPDYASLFTNDFLPTP